MGESNPAANIHDDLLLKNFFAEVSEVERDNEVLRYLFFRFLIIIYDLIRVYGKFLGFFGAFDLIFVYVWF